MHRLVLLPLLGLLVLPLLSGCQRLEARMVLREANSDYQQEQYSKALDKYEVALKLDPNATFAWRSVGLAALALYRPGDDTPKNVAYGKKALEAFQKYLADYPDDSKVQNYLLSTLVNAKQYDQALAYLDTLEKEHPGDPLLLKTRLNILIPAGRLDEAYALAQKFSGPDQAQLLYTIGTACWGKVFNNATIDMTTRQRYIQMGLQAIQKAIQIKPDYFEAMVYYGLLYRELAKVEVDGNKRLEDVAIATQWQQKALELRKKAAATPAAGESSGK
jgi:tetratricopeptide (TPR) repeat protein